MNVYDFDNTIYDGESLVDFFKFCIMKKKSFSLYLPIATYSIILYKLNLLPIEKINILSNKMSNIVIKNKECANSFIKEFWEKNKYKLKRDFLDKIKSTDIIITASPRILIEAVASELKTKNIICSEFNLGTGKFEFICFRENKVVAFNERYPDAVIDEFYTDSFNDLPLMELAKKSYLVKRKSPPILIDKNKKRY